MTTELNKIIPTLSVAGLDEFAARIYLTVLESGPSTVLQISRTSNIKRSTCYLHLEQMAWQGIASSTNDGKRIRYSVISPAQLAQRAIHRSEKLTRLVSKLQAIASKSPFKPKITTFEGHDGVARVFDLILAMPKGSHTYVYGTNLANSTYDETIRDFLINKNDKMIITKAIFADTKTNRSNQVTKSSAKREVRYLPADSFDPKTQTNIFGDTVAYLAHGENEPFVTIIESPTLAHDEIERFKILWGIAKK